MKNDTTKAAPDGRGVLKPCPFCGGDWITYGYVRDGESIGCADCSVRIVKYYGKIQNTMARLAEAWNTRTPPQIKPLVWTMRGSLGSFAEVSFGSYHAQWDDEVRAWYGSLELGEHENPIILDPADVQTEHKAQDACQADYTRRILEALA